MFVCIYTSTRFAYPYRIMNMMIRFFFCLVRIAAVNLRFQFMHFRITNFAISSSLSLSLPILNNNKNNDRMQNITTIKFVHISRYSIFR